MSKPRNLPPSCHKLSSERKSLYKVDLMLVHPPSTLESPTKLSLHNMIAASVPSTPAFEMYPIGFLSIGEYLNRHGYDVGICNLAFLHSICPGIKPEIVFRWKWGRAVGIDLQWASNTSGALQTARMIKRLSPLTPVIVGGLTASYFWKDLLSYSEVDYIIRGDSAEYQKPKRRPDVKLFMVRDSERHT